jgi:hypothetical protein
MAFGIGEDPARSVTPFLETVEYPARKADLVRAAEEGGATVDVINVVKSLPGALYRSADAVMRDLAEATRRFGMGNQPGLDDDANRERRNLGKDAVENAPEPLTRHP